MAIKYHVSNGCSFSTKKSRLSCHQHMGQQLGLEPCVNLAKGGRGNERVAATTMTWFYQNPERVKDTFVSIGWSSSHRWDYVHSWSTADHVKREVPGIKRAVADFTYQWGTWRSWEQEFFVKDSDLHVEHTAAVKTLISVLTLQNFFKLHGIPYVMYWALSNDIPADPDIQLLADQIDRDRFYNFEPTPEVKSTVSTMFDWFMKRSKHIQLAQSDYCQSHFEYCVRHNVTKSRDDGHPNKYGHHQWGDLLTEFVRNQKLLPND